MNNGSQRTPEEIRGEIHRTREQLADTAAALAHKADVKARTRERVSELRSTVAGKAPESAGGAAHAVSESVKSNPVPTAAIAAALLGFALGYLLASKGGAE